MPWTCVCAAENTDDATKCACGMAKATWTVIQEKTRTFQLSRGKFLLLRGDDEETRPAGEPPADASTEADCAWVMPAAQAREVFDRGHAPAGKHVLTVHVSPGTARRAEVQLVPLYESQPADPLVFPRQAAGASYEERFLFVCGAEPSLADVSFPGIHVVPVGEDTARGHAPAVEVSALKKKGKELPARRLQAASAFIFSI